MLPETERPTRNESPTTRRVPAWAMRVGAVTLSVALLVAASLAARQAHTESQNAATAYLRAHYTKQELRIPMRDGVLLFTAVYAPKDTSKTHPILLTRTPYGVPPYGEGNMLDSAFLERFIKEEYLRDGYIFALQDVRGQMMSGGEFVHVRPHNPKKTTPKDVDESSDTYDTVDYLIKHLAGHNGKVGIWGISYPGFYSTCSLIDAHPAVKAVSPQAPVTDWFIGDDFRHNGAVFLAHAFAFIVPFSQVRTPTPVLTLDRQWTAFDPGTLDGYDFFLRLRPVASAVERYLHGRAPYWREFLEHDTYDAYWQARNIRNFIRNVTPAVLTVGGWFDAEDLFGALATYRAIEAASPTAQSTLVMGPWVHGGWARSAGDGLGRVRFDAPTAAFYREQIELPFFAHHLKGAPPPNLPEAWVFETGRNVWRAHDTWPPRNAAERTFYFQGGGKLSPDAPADEGFAEYVSDPDRPVPYVEAITMGMQQEYMVADQRFAARRPDVLVFETEPLEAPVTAAGPIAVSLRVSTTGTDSDFIVKLVDVYPAGFPEPAPLAGEGALVAPGAPGGYSSIGGYQQLVRGEPFRGKFRASFEKPEPFVPGEPASIRFRMPDVYHTFRRGHRIMVQVQSTWFPLVDINPQTFTRIGFARPSEFRKATQRVYWGRTGGSRIVMPVL